MKKQGDMFVPVLGRDAVPPTAGLAALVDVETTGLSPKSDRIVEFAGILFAYHRQSGEVLGRVYEYASLNNPGIPISSAAMAVHGIAHNMVKRQRMSISTIDALLMEAEFIVAHNASFDRGFLAPISNVARSKTWVCSMRNIDWRACGHQSCALQNLLLQHGIRPQNAHRALEDVRCTLNLLMVLDPNGAPYLKQLLPHGGPTSRVNNEADTDSQLEGHNDHAKIESARRLNIKWTVKR